MPSTTTVLAKAGPLLSSMVGPLSCRHKCGNFLVSDEKKNRMRGAGYKMYENVECSRGLGYVGFAGLQFVVPRSFRCASTLRACERTAKRRPIRPCTRQFLSRLEKMIEEPHLVKASPLVKASRKRFFAVFNLRLVVVPLGARVLKSVQY